MTTNTVHVLLIDGFADWEPAIVLAELRSELKWSVVTVGVGDAEVRSMGGLKVIPDTTIEAVASRDVRALLVPGGDRWTEAERPAVTRLLREAWGAGATVAGICAGTVALARAGLLDEHPHTSNGLDFLTRWVPGYLGKAHYRDALALRDGRLVTAPGNGYAEWSREVLGALGAMPEDKLAEFYGFVKPKA